MEFLSEVRPAGVSACIIVEGRLGLLKVIAKMAMDQRAEPAMFGDELGQIADRLEARIFRDVRAFEAFIIMDRPFLGVRQRRIAADSSPPRRKELR